MPGKLQSACAQVPLDALLPPTSIWIHHFDLLWARNNITVCTAPDMRGWSPWLTGLCIVKDLRQTKLQRALKCCNPVVSLEIKHSEINPNNSTFARQKTGTHATFGKLSAFCSFLPVSACTLSKEYTERKPCGVKSFCRVCPDPQPECNTEGGRQACGWLPARLHNATSQLSV